MKKSFIKRVFCILSIIALCVTLFSCNDAPVGQKHVTENDVVYYSNVTSESNSFQISDGFQLSFEKDALKKPFNRLTFVYSSDKPLHINVTYALSLRTVTDDYYLDAGNGVSFSGLISGYLKHKKAKRLISVSFDVLDGDSANFKLHSITSELLQVIKGDVYYLENERYVLGIRLSWGGGINYIKDKQCAINGLENLVNSHDTGRLIQQSYYGTMGNEEYQAGNYQDVAWGYNPVQGGNLKNKPSRLIDLEIGDDYVYVKTQPQDWGHKNYLTPSYMENRYSLNNDNICVDNKFTDYSGWEHPVRSQELPAFYTVSYLDTFVYYDGTEPWNNADLTLCQDLPFWGGEYHLDCTFALSEGNSETWCAWFNQSSDYGIGLYVPSIDVYFAGRFSYDGSKSAKAPSTNYVAPLNDIRIVSYEPIKYSYLITTGSIASIRQTFFQAKEFTDNSSLRNNYVSTRKSAENQN